MYMCKNSLYFGGGMAKVNYLYLTHYLTYVYYMRYQIIPSIITFILFT